MSAETAPDAATGTVVYERPETGIESEKSLRDRMAFEAARIAEMKKFVKAHMTEGQDFGVIPGTGTKPTLFKPGAEIMCGIYRYEPEYEIAESYEPERIKNWTRAKKEWSKADKKMKRVYQDGKPVMEEGMCRGRYEVRATCTLRHITSGHAVGQGVGSCNSWEAKYVTVDLDDTKNTILKMAQKRAYVAATLSACRLSAFFTQDLEDIPPAEHEEPRPEPAARKSTRPAPRAEDVDLGRPATEAAPPADLPPEDENVAIGTVTKLLRAVRTGPLMKDGTPKWVLHTVELEGGQTFGTFSSSHTEAAAKAMDDGVPVRIAWKLTAKGNTEIVKIERAF